MEKALQMTLEKTAGLELDKKQTSKRLLKALIKLEENR